MTSSHRALLLLRLLFLQLLFRPSSQFGATTTVTVDSSSPSLISQQKLIHTAPLSGSWSDAKLSLRNPNCCVVSISGLDHHLSTLQTYFCGEDAPSDIDLRIRVRCDNTNRAREDCSRIYTAIMDPQSNPSQQPEEQDSNNPCILALQELAQGICSLADGQLQSSVTDVHMRVVCASHYKAIDPPFHTDKCPLRGYVTLTGPGTEYMETTCKPWEYVALRTLGVEGLAATNRDKVQNLKMANELEFIVMKGDYYDASFPEGRQKQQQLQQLLQERSIMNNKKIWSRSDACVHRSPPGNKATIKRVILSLDLADGRDDQEWEERGRKRSWRVGMTQRKSHLVS